ncbi:MAG: 2Fe-2S iron-sulfur cluster binding domain-containing protein [Magnetococcales bacterium]|nr:2Fe-2S iron-sulfur cluster binding domain-containing protein [Magnetococcales bacterium]
MTSADGYTLLYALGVLLLAAALVHLLNLVSRSLWQALVRVRRERLEWRLLGQRLDREVLAFTLEQGRGRGLWHGQRKLRVARKVAEGEGVCSLWLEPHDGGELPAFLPGQYLTFEFRLPGEPKPLTRCYSLSGNPLETARYRVTVKRQSPPEDHPEYPAGRISSLIHDRVQEGDILDVLAPAGHFTLDAACHQDLVLIAGGIGITPQLSKLYALAAGERSRDVWFFYGVRHGGEAVFSEELRHLAAGRDWLKTLICYSRPRPEDQAAPGVHLGKRVEMALLREMLPSLNAEFHLCGPPAMMTSLYAGLLAAGVPEEKVVFEAFGPASIRRRAGNVETAPRTVRFLRSGKEAVWDENAGTLLELAERLGVPMESGCRAGNCGSCLTAIKKGGVTHLTPPGPGLAAGTCLACIAQPESDLDVDA